MKYSERIRCPAFEQNRFRALMMKHPLYFQNFLIGLSQHLQYYKFPKI